MSTKYNPSNSFSQTKQVPGGGEQGHACWWDPKEQSCTDKSQVSSREMNWNLKPTLDSKESLVYVYSWQCLLLRKSANFSQRTEKWDGQVEFSLSQSLKSTSFSETEGTHSVQTTCKVLVAQSCLTLCDPMDCSPPVSSVHGILQARILEWLPYLPLRDLPNSGIEPGNQHLPWLLPCRQILYSWVTREAHLNVAMFTNVYHFRNWIGAIVRIFTQ